MLTSDQLTAISRVVALEHGRALSVQTVAVTEGGSGRAEVLVTIGGCHKAPCRFVVNVTRGTPEEFELEFRVRLSDAIVSHNIKPATRR